MPAINRNTNLTGLCDALEGTWERTVKDNCVIVEQKDITIVRVFVTGGSSLILPIKVNDNTPYTFYTRNKIAGGVIVPSDEALKFEENGILEYSILSRRK